LIDAIMQMPALLGLPVFCILTAAVGIATLLLFKLLFARLERSSDYEKVAANVLRLSGALLGLLLSLTFSSILTKIAKVRDTVELEAAQLADIHNDLEQFETEAATAIQGDVMTYTKILIDEEWDSLARDHLSPSAQALFGKIQLGILDLETVTPRQISLRSNLIQDIDEISDFRQARLHHATVDSLLFLSIALVGFVVVSALFSVQETNFAALILISLYFIFVGVVLYFIVAMNDPFSGVSRVSVEPIKTVFQNMTSS
jgi:hypothetical protein